MIVKVIEFVRPNGRQVVRDVTIDDGLSEKVKMIQKEGMRLTLERLGNGLSSVTIEIPKEGDILVEIPEESKWEEAVSVLLDRYTPEMLKEWREMMGDE